LHAAELRLTSPLDYQVIQRTSREKGKVQITGSIADAAENDTLIEARTISGGVIEKDPAWQTLHAKLRDGTFEAEFEVLSGGWRQLEVRASRGGKAIGAGAVEHVGVGEVFVVAGQSNSANHGEEKQATATKRVASFDGTRWKIGDDPQPGASGSGGSFLPPFADAIVEKFDMPVGLIACGIGATSVREWLPKGATFPNPPTIESRVEKLPTGEWSSKGEAFAHFVARMKYRGPNGFRAVLWHQGESDANQKDTTRTLSGSLYRDYLERVIRDSRREIGWDAPWFVAQVSYHTPGDEASPDIRAAQASLWKDGIALEGPDSDALKGDLRDSNGQGVHFSGKGLREHGARWAEKVIPWLETQIGAKP
jgi:hypothetical protein